VNEVEQLSGMAEIIEANVIEEGAAIGVLLRERDGTVSAIRIAVEQLAD
jgi:hypothetical protein